MFLNICRIIIFANNFKMLLKNYAEIQIKTIITRPIFLNVLKENKIYDDLKSLHLFN